MQGVYFGLAGAVVVYLVLGWLLKNLTYEQTVAVVVSVSLLIGVVEVIL